MERDRDVVKQIEKWLSETSYRNIFNSTDVADRLLRRTRSNVPAAISSKCKCQPNGSPD